MDETLIPDPTTILTEEQVQVGTPTIGPDGTVIYTAPKLVDVPEDILRIVDLPPERIRNAIAQAPQATPCGMPVGLVWRSGPSQGMPVTLWCAEPLCIDEGGCTGPRFVPHMAQFTHADPDHPERRMRKLTPPEVIAAVRRAAELVFNKTHVKDNRSDREIARHVGMVWQRAKKAVQADGQWGPG